MLPPHLSELLLPLSSELLLPQLSELLLTTTTTLFPQLSVLLPATPSPATTAPPTTLLCPMVSTDHLMLPRMVPFNTLSSVRLRLTQLLSTTLSQPMLPPMLLLLLLPPMLLPLL